MMETATSQVGDNLTKRSQSALTARQLDRLVLLPLSIGLLGITVISYFAKAPILNDAYDQAVRQFQLSRDLGDIASGLRAPSDIDRKQLKASVDLFERGLKRLESAGGLFERDILSDPVEMSGGIREVRSVWTVLKPLIVRLDRKTSPQTNSDSNALNSATQTLAETSHRLASTIAASRQRRFSMVVVICASCLLLLPLVRLFIRRRLLAPRSLTKVDPESAKPDIEPESIVIEAERRHTSNLIENIVSGILVLTADLTILSVNRSLLDMFGFADLTAMNSHLDEFLSRLNLHDKAAAVLSTGDPQTHDVLHAPGGEVDRVLRMYISVSHDVGGEARVQIIFEDVTEIGRLRNTQQDGEQRYHELMKLSTDGIIIMDESGHITGFNRSAERMFGYPHSEVIGKSIQFLTSAGSPALVESAVKVVGKALAFDGRRQNGATFPAEIVVHRQNAGPHVSIMGSVRDLTERKRLDFLERDCLQVLEMVTNNRDLDVILGQLISTVQRQRAGILCSVSLLRDGRLHYAAAPALPKDFVTATDGLPMSPSACSCGTAAYRRQMTLVSDIRTDQLWGPYQHLGHSHDLRAAWSAPIFSGLGTVLGTFAMYSRNPGQPDEGELYLLEMASRMAAVAIEQRQLTDRLTYQAHHDTLTTLPNRSLFEDRLQQAIATARRNSAMIGILFIDLDQFKLINDTLGHSSGDTLLQQVTQRLKSAVRPSDTLARTGGDEFAVIVEPLSDPAGASRVAHKLLDVLKDPIQVAGRDLFVTASVGVSMYPADGQDSASLLRNADTAMYRAKDRGRNNFKCFVPEMGHALLEQLDVQNDLHRALDRDELSVYYQPQFDVSNGKLAAWEALVRWRHPSLGLIMPGQFIPAAEESGLIGPIGAWVMEQSCRQSREWQKSGHRPIPIAVNVSSLQLRRGDFVDSVASILHESKLNPDLLELEVTESQLIKDAERFRPRLSELKDLGVRIAIDDFGTGYSSLNYLQHLPFDSLKIDKSFVAAMKPDTTTPLLIDSIVTLTHNLGMSVTAEGVETEAQLNALSEIGCDRAQGFLLSKALTVDGAARFLNRQPGPKATTRELLRA
jgi:diguanylate cyclase (GGDEF)-like protein/PAS domain S-box-containing protein